MKSKIHLIFSDSTPDSVEKCLVEYMEENIDPAGWKGVWKATKQTALQVLGIESSLNLLVDVSL